MNGGKQTERFFRSDAHTVYSHGQDAHPLRRPGIRARLAVLAAALTIFASAALITPSFAQDTPKDTAVAEQVVEQAQDSITVTTPEKFANDVIAASSDQPVLLYIYSPDCHYCENYGPALEIETELSDDVKLVKLNVDAHPEFTWGMFEDMQGVPTVAVYAHGFFIDKKEGAPPEGKEFEAAQAVVNYAAQVWRIVGDQLEKDAPAAKTGHKQKPAARTGM